MASAWDEDATVNVPERDLAILKGRLDSLQREVKRLTLVEQVLRNQTPQNYAELERTVRSQNRELQDLRRRVVSTRGGHGVNATSPAMERSEFEESLETGVLLDAVDQADEWLVAVVKVVTAADVLVQFHGWGDAWNQWFPKSSRKIAPFGTKTRGGPQHADVDDLDNTLERKAQELQLENSRLRLQRDSWKRILECTCKDDVTVIYGVFERAFALESDVSRCKADSKDDKDQQHGKRVLAGQLRAKTHQLLGDISTLRPAMDQSNHIFLQPAEALCNSFLEQLGETGPLADAKTVHVHSEQQFNNLMASKFQAVSSGQVPASSLFCAVGQALFLRQTLIQRNTATGELTFDLASELAKTRADQLAVGTRSNAVKFLNKNLEAYRGDVKSALVAALDAKRPTPTQLALAEEMRSAFPLHPAKHADSVAGHSIYCRVMERQNTAAQPLMLRVLSDAFQMAIDVYQFDPSQNTFEANPVPSQRFGQQYAYTTPAVSVLYSPSSGVYSLLLLKPSAIQRSVSPSPPLAQASMSSVHMAPSEADAVASLSVEEDEEPRPQFRHQRSVSPERLPARPSLLKERSRYHRHANIPSDDEEEIIRDTQMETTQHRGVRATEVTMDGADADSQDLHARAASERPPSSTSTPTTPARTASAVSSSPLHSAQSASVSEAQHLQAGFGFSPATRSLNAVSLSMKDLQLDGAQAAKVHVVFRFNNKSKSVAIPLDQSFELLMAKFAQQNKVRKDRVHFVRADTRQELAAHQSPQSAQLPTGAEILVQIK